MVPFRRSRKALLERTLPICSVRGGATRWRSLRRRLLGAATKLCASRMGAISNACGAEGGRSVMGSALPVWPTSAVRFGKELWFNMLRANGRSDFLPSEASVGGRTKDRLAKINERLKLGMPRKALNGRLWVSAGGGVAWCRQKHRVADGNGSHLTIGA